MFTIPKNATIRRILRFCQFLQSRVTKRARIAALTQRYQFCLSASELRRLSSFRRLSARCKGYCTAHRVRHPPKRLLAVADDDAPHSEFLATKIFSDRRRQPKPPPPTKPTSEPTADNQRTLRRKTATGTERQPAQPATPQPTARHTADRHRNATGRSKTHPPPQPPQRTARHRHNPRRHTTAPPTTGSTKTKQEAAHLSTRTARPAKPTTATTRQTDKPHNKHPQTDRQNTTTRDHRHGQPFNRAGAASAMPRSPLGAA